MPWILMLVQQRHRLVGVDIDLIFGMALKVILSQLLFDTGHRLFERLYEFFARPVAHSRS